jgi:hypothetical protein
VDRAATGVGCTAADRARADRTLAARAFIARCVRARARACWTSRRTPAATLWSRLNACERLVPRAGLLAPRAPDPVFEPWPDPIAADSLASFALVP